MRRIAELSEGFSGSEIEPVIVAALFSAYAVNRPISTQLILDELKIAKLWWSNFRGHLDRWMIRLKRRN